MTKTLITAAFLALLSSSAFAGGCPQGWNSDVSPPKCLDGTLPVATFSGVDYTTLDKTVGKDGYGIEQWIDDNATADDTNGGLSSALGGLTNEGLQNPLIDTMQATMLNNLVTETLQKMLFTAAAAYAEEHVGRDETGELYVKNVCPVDETIVGDNTACVGAAYTSLSLLQNIDVGELDKVGRSSAMAEVYDLTSKLGRLQIQIAGQTEPGVDEMQVSDQLVDVIDLKRQVAEVRQALRQTPAAVPSLAPAVSLTQTLMPTYNLIKSAQPATMDRYGNKLN